MSQGLLPMQAVLQARLQLVLAGCWLLAQSCG